MKEPLIRFCILREGETAPVARVVFAFHPLGRNLRSVWAINPEPFSAKEYGIEDSDHFAAFPVKLVEPMVRLSCPAGGTVLDPLMGTGTVGWVATQLGREFIGIDVSAEYVEMARRRIAGGPLLAMGTPSEQRT